MRWPTTSAGQNVRANNSGCSLLATPNVFSIAAAGGSFRFDVVQQSDPTECGGPRQNACVWTARSTVPWIAVTTAGERTGDDLVSFTVAANATGSGRVGTITVRDQV